HPFQVQLSRSLAQRGHEVVPAHCASLQTTPRGALEPQPDDPAGFRVEPISLRHPITKYSFVRRWGQENVYGRLLVRAASRFRPDVVLSGNTPLDAQRRILKYCRQEDIGFVFWVQDLIGVASARLLKEKIPIVGGTVGEYYARMERTLLQKSDGVVLITEDFRPLLEEWGVDPHRVSVIENWAPLDELPQRPRENDWSRRQGLDATTNLVYTGTLGMKHNPEILLELAERFRGRADVRVVVVSQGLGADWLEERKRERNLQNLLILGFQPFEDMPDVLGSAAVLLAVLEPDAGIFSVPSKVLSYLCASRPVLLAVPPENLAARIVTENDACRIVAPTDTNGFVAAAEEMLDDAGLRRRLGENARRYAESTFDIGRISNDFEAALERVLARRVRR